MKLRMKENSVRLRLTRSEVARISAGEQVQESVQFSAAEGGALRYALRMERGSDAAVAVHFQACEIAVLLSEAAVKAWSREDEIGIYKTLDAGNGASLEIAIEKDFACLDRSDEENQDTYANPHAGQVC